MAAAHCAGFPLRWPHRAYNRLAPRPLNIGGMYLRVQKGHSKAMPWGRSGSHTLPRRRRMRTQVAMGRANERRPSNRRSFRASGRTTAPSASSAPSNRPGAHDPALFGFLFLWVLDSCLPGLDHAHPMRPLPCKPTPPIRGSQCPIAAASCQVDDVQWEAQTELQTRWTCRTA